MTTPCTAIPLGRFPSLHPSTLASQTPIWDGLLSQYPGIAKTLAEGQRQRGIRQVPESASAAYSISRLSYEVRAFIEVDEGSGCWVWQHTDCEGYGYVPAALRHGNPECRAHRFSYTELVGPIPQGFIVDHVRSRGCLFKACCWPAHLQAVTHAENCRRGASDRQSGSYDAAMAARVRSLMATGLSKADIHRRTGIRWRIIAAVAAAGERAS
jgi:hypothetical protein